MSKKRVIIVTVIILSVVAVLSAAFAYFYTNNFSDISGSTLENPQEEKISHLVDTSKEAIDSYELLLDDSFIYMYMGDNGTSYYRHYFKDDKVVELGCIPNFVISSGFSVLHKDIMYFYATVDDESGYESPFGNLKNILYGIDLKENKLQIVSRDTEYLPAAFILPYKDTGILTLRTKRDNNNVMISFVDITDIDTNRIIAKSEEYFLDDNEYLGSIILNCCAYDNYIYVLIKIVTEDRNSDDNRKTEAVINVYDNNFELVRTINMEAVREYIMSARVGKMWLWDNFIFMRNYSGDGFIGIIENDEIKPIMKEADFDINMSFFSNQSPVFFARNTNKIFTIDTENKKVNEISLGLKNDYKILTALAKNDNLLVHLYSDNKKPLIYYIPISKLGTSELN